MSRPRSIEKIAASELVTISELVQLSGMRYSTIKYYTEINLLPFEQEDTRLVRRYPRESSLARLEEIKQLKNRGLTIEEIKEKLINI